MKKWNELCWQNYRRIIECKSFLVLLYLKTNRAFSKFSSFPIHLFIWLGKGKGKTAYCPCGRNDSGNISMRIIWQSYPCLLSSRNDCIRYYSWEMHKTKVSSVVVCQLWRTPECPGKMNVQYIEKLLSHNYIWRSSYENENQRISDLISHYIFSKNMSTSKIGQLRWPVIINSSRIIVLWVNNLNECQAEIFKKHKFRWVLNIGSDPSYWEINICKISSQVKFINMVKLPANLKHFWEK